MSMTVLSAVIPFNLYAEHIMKNAKLGELQAGIKIAGRYINNLKYADDTTLMAESEEELKRLLTLESTHWAPRDPCRDLRGKRSPLLPLEARPKN